MINVQKKYMDEEMNKMEGYIGDDYIQHMRDNIDLLSYDLSQVIFTYVSSLIVGFALAALIARMVRRQPTFEA